MHSDRRAVQLKNHAKYPVVLRRRRRDESTADLVLHRDGRGSDGISVGGVREGEEYLGRDVVREVADDRERSMTSSTSSSARILHSYYQLEDPTIPHHGSSSPTKSHPGITVIVRSEGGYYRTPSPIHSRGEDCPKMKTRSPGDILAKFFNCVKFDLLMIATHQSRCP